MAQYTLMSLAIGADGKLGYCRIDGRAYQLEQPQQIAAGDMMEIIMRGGEPHLKISGQPLMLYELPQQPDLSQEG